MKYVKQQSGVGLIEVLVTLLILSTSLITLTAMQNRSLQFNQMAYFRSQANMMAYDILDRIRLNKSNLNNNLASYSIALAAFSGSAPSSVNITATDIYEWRRDIDARLPNGKGAISCDNATNVCDITISWDEINSTSVANASESTSKFVYSARI